MAGEHGNTMVVVNNIYCIIRVYTYTGGAVKLSITFPVLPKLSQKLSLFCKHLDTVVSMVCYVYIASAVECHTPCRLH